MKNISVWGCLVVAIVMVSIVDAGQTFNQPGIHYKDDVSGSFASGVLDTDGDGIAGVNGFLEGRSTFGRVTIHTFSEFDTDSAGETADCPEGQWELPVVISSTILRFRMGMVFLQTVDETFCVDPTTGAFTWAETQEVTGGTGRFANASGSLEVIGSGTMLLSDALVNPPLGTAAFGAMTMHSLGEIDRDGEARERVSPGGRTLLGSAVGQAVPGVRP